MSGLPIQTERGIIEGLPPAAWMIGPGRDYHSCCLDPRNWEGYGDEFKLGIPKTVLGKRMTRFRMARCAKCWAVQVAHELLP